MVKVIVYSTPACPYCKKVKQYLKDKGVEFEDVNVAEDKERAKEMIESTGQMSVPAVEIGNTIILGFEPDAMDKALAEEESEDE